MINFYKRKQKNKINKIKNNLKLLNFREKIIIEKFKFKLSNNK